MSKSVADPSPELTRSLELFNQFSSQLARSYHELEQRVAQLSGELAAARDERLRQLAEQERLAARLRQLLELLPGGLVVVDGTGVVVDCNATAAELLGDPLAGRPWQVIVERALAPAPAGAGEVPLRSGRRISVSTRPLEAEPGHIILLLDVTEQHDLREMVQRHQRLSALGEMAARLAHQIRTPLSSALLYGSQLASPTITAAKRARFIDSIMGRLRHLERIVNDLLRFAQSGEFEADDIDVQILIDDLFTTLEPQLQGAGGRLTSLNRAPGARLRGSREALHSALLNLATNAIQACGQRPMLHLEVRRDGPGCIEISLADNGPGIPEALREKVFMPFFTTRSDGTGLGLPVARAIVVAHRGDLWMRSSEAGTVFGLRIPGIAPKALVSGGVSADCTAPPSVPRAIAAEPGRLAGGLAGRRQCKK